MRLLSLLVLFYLTSMTYAVGQKSTYSNLQGTWNRVPRKDGRATNSQLKDSVYFANLETVKGVYVAYKLDASGNMNIFELVLRSDYEMRNEPKRLLRMIGSDTVKIQGLDYNFNRAGWNSEETDDNTAVFVRRESH